MLELRELIHAIGIAIAAGTGARRADMDALVRIHAKCLARARLGASGATFNVTGGSGGTITWTAAIDQANAANAVSIGGSNANTINFGGAGTINVTGGVYSSTTSSFAGITQSGTGTLILAGSNSYGGTTTVSSGVLSLANANSTGTSALVVSRPANKRSTSPLCGDSPGCQNGIHCRHIYGNLISSVRRKVMGTATRAIPCAAECRSRSACRTRRASAARTLH